MFWFRWVAKRLLNWNLYTCLLATLALVLQRNQTPDTEHILADYVHLWICLFFGAILHWYLCSFMASSSPIIASFSPECETLHKLWWGSAFQISFHSVSLLKLRHNKGCLEISGHNHTALVMPPDIHTFISATRFTTVNLNLWSSSQWGHGAETGAFCNYGMTVLRFGLLLGF